jgi:hypothetical protein
MPTGDAEIWYVRAPAVHTRAALPRPDARPQRRTINILADRKVAHIKLEGPSVVTKRESR